MAGAPDQSYVVPTDICALAIDVWAGDGGDGDPDPTFFGIGGPGVHVVGEIGVGPGDQLTIVVGGAGGDGCREPQHGRCRWCRPHEWW